MRSFRPSPTLTATIAILLVACSGNQTPMVSSIALTPNGTVQPCASVDINVTASAAQGAKLKYAYAVVDASDASLTPRSDAVVASNGSSASFAISPSPNLNATVRVRVEISDGPRTITALSAPITVLGGPGQPCGSIEGRVRPSIQFFGLSAGTPAGAEFVPNEAIVKLKPENLRPSDLTSSRDRISFARPIAGGAGVIERQGARPLSLEARSVRADSPIGLETLRWIAALRARPDVESAEPNLILRAQTVPADPLYAGGPNPARSQRWHYEMLNLPAAWDQSLGAGATVAVIDTGLLWSQTDPARRHPDFDCQVAPGVPKVLPGFDFLQGDADPYDSDPGAEYHGTHVAGTVGACANNALGGVGVAWNARILPIRALSQRGGSLEDIARAIYWAIGASIPASFGSGANVPVNPNPANVINMSLGGQGKPSQVLQDAIDAATARGAVVVVAAGNDGIDASGFLPANQQGVIAVGALGPTRSRTSYSNYGPTVSLMAPGGDQGLQHRTEDGVLSSIGVCPKDADGANVIGCGTSVNPNFDFGFEQGTSMASPHVAGTVALMMGAQPSLLNPIDPAHNWVRVAGMLRDASSLTGLSLCQRGCGAGLLDASKAVTNAINDTGTGPLLVQRDAGTAAGGLDLGSSLSAASFSVQNLGTETASVSLNSSSPGLSVSPRQASVAPGEVLRVTVNLQRFGLTEGAYGSSIALSYGNRSFVQPVYYIQGGPGTLADATNVRVRLYRRDYACQSNEQRLNFPGLGVDQDGHFRFGTLENGTYDLVAYRLSNDGTDGAGVTELGRLDDIEVGNQGLRLQAQDVALEAVNLTIGAERPASRACIPKN